MNTSTQKNEQNEKLIKRSYRCSNSIFVDAFLISWVIPTRIYQKIGKKFDDIVKDISIFKNLNEFYKLNFVKKPNCNFTIAETRKKKSACVSEWYTHIIVELFITEYSVYKYTSAEFICKCKRALFDYIILFLSLFWVDIVASFHESFNHHSYIYISGVYYTDSITKIDKLSSFVMFPIYQTLDFLIFL